MVILKIVAYSNLKIQIVKINAKSTLTNMMIDQHLTTTDMKQLGPYAVFYIAQNLRMKSSIQMYINCVLYGCAVHVSLSPKRFTKLKTCVAVMVLTSVALKHINLSAYLSFSPFVRHSTCRCQVLFCYRGLSD